MTHAQLERPRRMLSALKAQAAALQRKFELIVAHSDDPFALTQISELLNELGLSSEFVINITAVPDATYCELKNAGAVQASSDIIIFLDCDVIPEPGWLPAILGAFDDPRVCAAVGNTYTDYSNGAYGKAMALAWMFPLREGDDGLEESTWFYANNAAFRRATFLERPFPITPGHIHYPAKLLVERLKRDGTTIWHVGGARVSHPPPNGARHFVKRALATGRARAFSEASPSSPSVVARIGADLRGILWHAKRMITARRSVDLHWWQLPAAITYAASFHLLVLGGYLLTLAAPKLMRSRFDL